jgi:hypothetical protein
MLRRSNPWPAFVDLFSALLIATFAGLIMFSGAYREMKKKNEALEKGGNFRLARAIIPAGDFQEYPVTDLRDPQETTRRIDQISREYQSLQSEFPYIFVIGHSNQKEAKRPEDRDPSRSRLERNWEYAGRRAAKIAYLLQDILPSDQKSRMVVVTTGEFDMKDPSNPTSPQNAWVEVVFGKEWKVPSSTGTN